MGPNVRGKGMGALSRVTLKFFAGLIDRSRSSRQDSFLMPLRRFNVKPLMLRYEHGIGCRGDESEGSRMGGPAQTCRPVR